MSRLSKDVLVDSDSDSCDIGPSSVEKVSTTSSTKRAPNLSRTKRTLTARGSSNDSKGKRRKVTTARRPNRDDTMEASDGTLRDVGSGNNLAAPLTRGDIPTIVSAVIQSIRSPHVPEDDEIESSTVPG